MTRLWILILCSALLSGCAKTSLSVIDLKFGNSSSRPCGAWVDEDMDNFRDKWIAYDYDNAGRLIQTREYPGEEDTPNHIVSYRYKKGGFLVLRDLDLDGNGSVDDRRIDRFDDIERLQTRTYVNFLDNKEIVQSVDHFVYDEVGRLLFREVDQRGDGSIDELESYSYDTAGRLKAKLNDNGADGRVDWSTTWTYEEGGARVIETVDGNQDGIPDGRTIYLLNAKGQRVLEKNLEIETGRMSQQITYVYDSAGRLLAEEHDEDGDGNTDFQTHFEYQCD